MGNVPRFLEMTRRGCAGVLFPSRAMRRLAAWLILLPFLGGCNAEAPESPERTPIIGGQSNDELAHGKLDPDRVECIFVYVCPRAMPTAYYWEDLAKCKSVVVLPGREPARELLTALSQEMFRTDIGTAPGAYVSMGTIRVGLRDSETLYLHYTLRERAQYLKAPLHADGKEGTGHYGKAWRSWLERHVYAALDLGLSSSPKCRDTATGGGNLRTAPMFSLAWVDARGPGEFRGRETWGRRQSM